MKKDSYDFKEIAKHFERFKEKREELGVADKDIWNMDETGFRVGCGIAYCVITLQKSKKLYLRDSEVRNFVTLTECINSTGRSIPCISFRRGLKFSIYGAIIVSLTNISLEQVSQAIQIISSSWTGYVISTSIPQKHV